MNKNIKVSVCMITYGHEKFIREAIEGVLMQQCDFEVEFIVANDCSPDATDAIVQNIITTHKNAHWINYVKHEKNIGMMPNFIFALQKAQGQYIAICEGDDYWTDPLKLQKQVDFLETNLNYTICWTNYKIKNEINDLLTLQEPEWIHLLNSKSNITIDLSSIFSPYCTYTLTTMFRRDSCDFSLFQSLKNGKDNSLYALCLSQGKGMLLNFNSAVYRIHQGGVYSSATIFKQNYFSYLNIKEIVIRIPLCDNVNIKNIRNYLLGSSIKSCPKILSVVCMNLVIDSVKYLGLKKSIKLVLMKVIKLLNGK